MLIIWKKNIGYLAITENANDIKMQLMKEKILLLELQLQLL